MNIRRITTILILIIIALGGITFYLKYTKFVLMDEVYSVTEDEPLIFKSVWLEGRSCRYRYFIHQFPEHGELVVSGDMLKYVPDNDYFGEDKIQYHISCWKRNSNTVSVDFRIIPVNDTPEAAAESVFLREDEPVVNTLKGLDKDGDPLDYRIIAWPTHGELTGEPPTLLYSPDADYFGNDSFSFMVSDGLAESDEAHISIVIESVNDVPVVKGQEKVGVIGLSVDLKAEVTDPDDENFVFKIISAPKNGSIEGLFPFFSYLPDPGFLGDDEIVFKIGDGESWSEAEKFIIHIRPIENKEQLKKVILANPNKVGVAVGEVGSPELIVNPEKYLPASIIKLATAAAAIDYLGEDFRFQTVFFISEERDLVIKGYGDPTLSTQDWRRIADEFARQGHFNVPFRDIILDDTAFDGDQDFDGRIEGINWFDAPLGPIVSNHNTAKIVVQADHSIRSYHGKTPITETILRAARGLPRGFQYLSIVRTPKEGTMYSGELAREVFAEYGASFHGEIKIERASPNLKPVYIHYSRLTLRDTIKEMLLYSSNFIANQLLLVMAIEEYGEPVNLKMGVSLIKDFLVSRVGLKQKDFNLVEGAGLSRQDEITLIAMLQVVNYFELYRDLMPALRQSKFADLIRIGKKRNIVAKTGTLTDVATVVGYMFLESEKWLPFVIMIDGSQKQRAEVLSLVAEYFQPINSSLE